MDIPSEKLSKIGPVASHSDQIQSFGMSGRATSWPNIVQFSNLRIRQSAFLNYIKCVDPKISRLEICKIVGRIASIIIPVKWRKFQYYNLVCNRTNFLQVAKKRGKCQELRCSSHIMYLRMLERGIFHQLIFLQRFLRPISGFQWQRAFAYDASTQNWCDVILKKEYRRLWRCWSKFFSTHPFP